MADDTFSDVREEFWKNCFLTLWPSHYCGRYPSFGEALSPLPGTHGSSFLPQDQHEVWGEMKPPYEWLLGSGTSYRLHCLRGNDSYATLPQTDRPWGPCPAPSAATVPPQVGILEAQRSVANCTLLRLGLHVSLSLFFSTDFLLYNRAVFQSEFANLLEHWQIFFSRNKIRNAG